MQVVLVCSVLNSQETCLEIIKGGGVIDFKILCQFLGVFEFESKILLYFDLVTVVCDEHQLTINYICLDGIIIESQVVGDNGIGIRKYWVILLV